MMEISQYTQTPDNLFALLSKYRVIVPGIQRHYVQGADNAKAKEVREGFVKSLLDGKEMQLHFVYGPINYENEDAFIPVDGQQRLTTLWLLARYAVERLGDENQRKDLLGLLSRFSYADRMHATRFCQALCSETWNVEKDPEQAIPKQNWFWDYWQQDETVASMLRMLSTIHCEWAAKQNVEPNDVLDSLVNKIKFSLRIDSFGDDIYMKMNARGLQLTQWENFKAKFADRLSTENANNELIQQYFKQKGSDKSVIKIWNEKIETLSNRYFDETSHTLPDDAFFALMGRVCYYLGYGDTDNEGNEIKRENLSALANFKGKLPYVPFDEFVDVFFESYKDENDNTPRKGRDINEFALQYLVSLDMILNRAKYEKEYLNSPYWEKRSIIDAFFNPQNENERDFSLCCFEYAKVYPCATYEDFRRAYRYMWNILENVNRGNNEKCYERVKWIAYYSALVQSAKLYPKNINTIDELKALLAKCFGEQKDVEQIWEEIAKGRHILDESGNLRKYAGLCKKKDNSEYSSWEEILMEAESHAFFKGAIRFLFRDENGDWNWKDFDVKWKNVNRYIDKKGEAIKPLYHIPFLSALLRSITQWSQLEQKRIFVNDSSTIKNNLLLAKDYVSEIHKILLAEKLNDIQREEFVDGENEIVCEIKNFISQEKDLRCLMELFKNKDLRFSHWCVLYPYGGRDAEVHFARYTNIKKVKNIKNVSINKEGINFEYNNNYFQWHTNNYIYSMKDTGEKSWNEKDLDAKEQEDRYYCFKVVNVDDIKKQIESLITEAAASSTTNPEQSE